MNSERFLVYDLAPATSEFYLRDPEYKDEVISSKPLDVQVTVNRSFLAFGLVENEPGKIEFVARAMKNILVEQGAEKVRDVYLANEDLHLEQTSFPIRIVDQVTGEQLLVDFKDWESDGLAPVGAKPIIPDPALSESVALKPPLISKPPMRSPHFVVGYPKRQGN